MKYFHTYIAYVLVRAAEFTTHSNRPLLYLVVQCDTTYCNEASNYIYFLEITILRRTCSSIFRCAPATANSPTVRYISGTCHILLFNIHTNQSHININISERLLCCVVKQSLLYILDVRKTICGSDNHFVLFFYYIVRTVQKLYIIEPSWLSRTTRVQLNVKLSN